jgi:hypothetical protein
MDNRSIDAKPQKSLFKFLRKNLGGVAVDEKGPGIIRGLSRY